MDPFTYISCFAGVGGLDLGLELAFPDARCIGRVEREIAASEIMAARIREGSLTDAPQWSDVRNFPSRLYRGRTRGILAGFPCPDYSCAGKRAGIVGKHGQLWDDLAAIIRDVGPDVVLLENVSGILVPHNTDDEGWRLPAGLWFVLGDLAALGLDAEWTCVSAGDTGASQERLRWFCLARRRGTGFKLSDPAWHEWHGLHGQRGARRGVREAGNELAVSTLNRWRQGRAESGRFEGRLDAAQRGGEMAQSGRERSERWRNSDLGGAQGAAEDHSEQRERSGYANGGLCISLDESECSQRGTDGISGNGCHEGADGVRETADRPGEPDGNLGLSERSRWTPSGRGPVIDAGEKPESRSGSLEHAAGSRLGWREDPGADCGNAAQRTRSIESKRGSGALGNSYVSGLERRDISGCGLPDERLTRPREYPVYPPGPGLGGAGVLDDIRRLYRRGAEEAWRRYQAELANTYRWIEILTKWPELAPALDEEEAKSIVLELGNELEPVLGNDRTNALRAVGNGVAPLPAAVSFVCLARRAGLTAMATDQTEDSAA